MYIFLKDETNFFMKEGIANVAFGLECTLLSLRVDRIAVMFLDWYSIHISPELCCKIVCFQKSSKQSYNSITRSRFDAATNRTTCTRRGVTFATNAATCLHAKTICIIISSFNVVSCQGSTVPIVRIARSIRRTWDLTCAEYIPINESSSWT